MTTLTIRSAAEGGEAPSEQIVKAASRVVRVTDALGRSLGVKKPGALDRMRLFKIIGGELAENGPYLSYAALAASVCELEGEAVRFPANQREIELMVERLGDDGLEAVGRAFDEEAGAGERDSVEAAKK